MLVCPKAKSGAPLRTAVGKRAIAPARLLLERGNFSVRRYDDAVRAACWAAGLRGDRRFTAGRFRHTVGTAAVNEGADPAAVAAFLGQSDPRTLRKFYATRAVVAKVPTPL